MFLLKKRYWLSITLLLTVFLVVRNFPATWVFYAVQKAAPGLQVSGVSGSLWGGEAEYSQWVDKGHTVPLGKLQWELEALSLLSLSPCANFSALAQSQTIKGNACYSVLSGKVVAEEIDISLPVARVAPFFSVDLDGTVDAYIQKATWQNQQLGETELNFLWQRASLFNGNMWVPLGSIQGSATDDGNGGLSSQLNHVEDAQQRTAVPLKLNIDASLTQLAAAQPKIQVNGNVTPDPGNAALKQMLQFVGEPTGDGSYRIDIRE